MGSPWVGLIHFKELFMGSRFTLIMRNTLGLSLLSIVFGFPVPIIFALLLNELRGGKFKKTVQTISYLPYFISWIILGGIFLSWLSREGFVNNMLLWLGLIDKPLRFMQTEGYFWPLLISTGIWKSFGYFAVIYLAAITSVDQEMYEASIIDGAGRFQRVWYITLPAIKTIIAITFIFAMSGVLNSNFDQIYIMRNNVLRDVSDVLDTYTFDMGISHARYSFATATGLFKSVVAVILLLITNFTAKKLSGSSLF